MLAGPHHSYGQEHERELQKDCKALSGPGHYPDYERVPDYSIERRNYDASNPKILTLQISVTARGFGGAAVVRLGCKLASDFAKETAIYVLIFDDKEAARRLSLGYTDQTDYGVYLWHLRGRYELNRQTNQQFIEVLVPEVKDGLLAIERIKYWLVLPD
jgi:hypothetical protein